MRISPDEPSSLKYVERNSYVWVINWTGNPTLERWRFMQASFSSIVVFEKSDGFPDEMDTKIVGEVFTTQKSAWEYIEALHNKEMDYAINEINRQAIKIKNCRERAASARKHAEEC